MRIVIAGLGSIGQRHLGNLRKLESVEVAAFRVRGQKLPNELSGDWLREYDRLDEALASKPELALICGPPATQMDVALAAAQAGCHLFIEKPISNSLAGMDELISIVRQKKLVTLIGYNLRYHPGMQLIKSMLDEKRIGRVVSIRASVGQYLPDWHPDEDYRQGYSARKILGGGVLLDLIHEMDYVRWLGGDVKEVFCFADTLTQLEIDSEDTASVLLRFGNGTIGSVHVDYVQRAPRRYCEIIGEEGTLELDLMSNEVRQFVAGQSDWEVFRNEGFDRNDMYIEEMRHLLACLQGAEKPMVDLENGAETLKITLAAKSSAENGSVNRVGR